MHGGVMEEVTAIDADIIAASNLREGQYSIHQFNPYLNHARDPQETQMPRSRPISVSKSLRMIRFLLLTFFSSPTRQKYTGNVHGNDGQDDDDYKMADGDARPSSSGSA
jgi:hypothetical protein